MFAHLHCHSRGSFSDSILKMEDAVEKAARDNQAGLAITDHGFLHRPLTFIALCRREGIVPVVGCEFYFVESAKQTIRTSDNRRYHLVLLAKNEKGLSNLISLINKSWEENCFMDRRGLIDWKLIKKYSSGLISLTGCYWNIISRTRLNLGEEEAENRFRELYDIFGSDLYSELGRHGVREEEDSNRLLIRLSEKYGVKSVVTNDVHYLNEEDELLHNCFIRSRFERLSSFVYEGKGYYFKTFREMSGLGFKKEYLTNTIEILDKCNVDVNSFIRGGEGATGKLSEMFDLGQAAFVPSIKKVTRREAGCLSGRLNVNAAAKGLSGQWREAEADFSRVAVSRNPCLTAITPVFKWRNLRVCQFPETELKKQGIFVSDLEKCQEKVLHL